jgi:hypothetical protein
VFFVCSTSQELFAAAILKVGFLPRIIRFSDF